MTACSSASSVSECWSPLPKATTARAISRVQLYHEAGQWAVLAASVFDSLCARCRRGSNHRACRRRARLAGFRAGADRAGDGRARRDGGRSAHQLSGLASRVQARIGSADRARRGTCGGGGPDRRIPLTRYAPIGYGPSPPEVMSGAIRKRCCAGRTGLVSKARRSSPAFRPSRRCSSTWPCASTGQRRVITLDTGRLPQETHDMIDAVRDRYGIAIDVVAPDAARGGRPGARERNEPVLPLSRAAPTLLRRSASHARSRAR